MNDKNGFLLAEETLKIIIAVICIAFLVYLLIALYTSNQEGKDKDFARSSLELILNNVKSKTASVEIFNPRKAFILSWPSDGKMPKVCENAGWENCLCICKTKFYQTNKIENFANSCSDCVCSQTSERIVIEPQEGIEIKNLPVILNLDYSSGIRIFRS